MPFFDVVDGRWHYLDSGSGSPPVVLLHGFTGSAADWEPLTAIWAAHYRCLAVDLPGHGQTHVPENPARYAMSAVAADLAAWLTALQTGPVHLLGYSMGGRLALYFALHYPELIRTVVLESGSPGLATAAEQAARQASDETLAERIVRDGIEPFVDVWESLPLWESQGQLPAEVRQALRQRRLQNRPDGLALSLRGMGTGVQPSLWHELSHLEKPVLLMAGQHDSKFVTIAQNMAPALPQVELTIVTAAGHTIHLEQPAVFGQLTHAFWQRHG